MTVSKGQTVFWADPSNCRMWGEVLAVEDDVIRVRNYHGRNLWIDVSSLVDESWRPRDTYG